MKVTAYGILVGKQKQEYTQPRLRYSREGKSVRTRVEKCGVGMVTALAWLALTDAVMMQRPRERDGTRTQSRPLAATSLVTL